MAFLPIPPRPQGRPSLLLDYRGIMYFFLFSFKDELKATRYCGPKEFVSCAADVESKEGVKPENKLLLDRFHTVGKKY